MTPPGRKVRVTRTKRGARPRNAPSASPHRPVDSAARAEVARDSRACPRCAMELDALGLPYRIVLRCTHGDD